MNVEKIVREYIDKTIHMSLATVKDNKPWVCEVHFAYDKNLNLYFRSLLSRRHSQEIANNPNVAGNIVKQHSLNEKPAGIYFEGTAKLLEAGEEQNLAFKILKERVNASDSAIEEAAKDDGHKFYKITVDKYYVFGPFSNFKKEELTWNGGKH